MFKRISLSQLSNASIVCALLILCIFPVLVRDSEYHLLLASTAGIYVLAAVGLNVLQGYTGQPSAGHGALVAVGAYASGLLTLDAGWNLFPAIAVAVAICLVIGAAMAIPARRISAWYFAALTLFLALVVPGLLVEWRSVTHGYQGLIGIPVPSFGGLVSSQRGMFWLIWCIVVVTMYFVHNLVKSSIGYAMVAVRDAELAAAASGADRAGLKMLAFIFSAGVAGLAGGLLGPLKGAITPEDFSLDLSVLLLVSVLLGGGGRQFGPVAGVLVFFLLPQYLTILSEYRLLLYGAALLLGMTFLPKGMVGTMSDYFRPWLRRHTPGVGTETSNASSVSEGLSKYPIARDGPVLQVSGLSKQFGGVVALANVSLQVNRGSLYALVGPNGSGKTTFLNCVSGFYRPDAGKVIVNGRDVAGLPTHRVARSGISRTFQTPQLIGELTVLENVILGAYGDHQATGLEVALRLPRARKEHRQFIEDAHRWLKMVGLSSLQDDLAEGLPHAQQRLVEICRAMMPRPTLVLMDEPAAGLSPPEIVQLKELLVTLKASGTSILIVDHHLELLADIADRVLVLLQGEALAEGDPNVIFKDSAVVEAYIGTSK